MSRAFNKEFLQSLLQIPVSVSTIIQKQFLHAKSNGKPNEEQDIQSQRLSS